MRTKVGAVRKRERQEQYGQHWLSRRAYHAEQAYHLRYQDLFLDRLSVKNGTCILECGSGDGSIKQRIIDKNSEIFFHYYCLDVSRLLLKHIIDNSKTGKQSVTALNASVESIPFESNSIDVVFALSVLWYVPELSRAIEEMYRVLKPGGKLCFDVISLLHPTGLLGNLTNVFSVRFRNVYRMNYVIPSLLISQLRKKGISVTCTGYLPFLPTSLPLVGDRFNLFQYLRWLPKINNIFLSNFCNKVVFQIQK